VCAFLSVRECVQVLENLHFDDFAILETVIIRKFIYATADDHSKSIVCIYVCVCVCACVQEYARANSNLYIYTSIDIYIYICMDVYVYIYI